MVSEIIKVAFLVFAAPVNEELATYKRSTKLFYDWQLVRDILVMQLRILLSQKLTESGVFNLPYYSKIKHQYLPQLSNHCLLPIITIIKAEEKLIIADSKFEFFLLSV